VEDLAAWLASHPLPPEQAIGIAELGRTDSFSTHIVQIRDQEPLHVHAHHDLLAILKRGRGSLRLGPETLVMKTGSIIQIPRGTPHAFRNEARQSAVALVVFSPPFDGQDTVPVSE